MKRRYDHVIWDWNGTLMADIDLSVASVNRLLREAGINEIDTDRYRQLFRFPVRHYYELLGLPTDTENFARISRGFYENFLAGLADCSLVPGTPAVLAQLRQQGYRQTLLSAAEERALHQMVDAVSARHYFDEIRGTNDYSAGSKLPQGLALMADSQIAADRTVLIGDTEHDAEVSKALGCDLILVSYGHQCPTRWEHLGAQVAHSPAELSNFL